MKTEPKVFVITLNWNGRKWLEDCLDSVLHMDYPNFEVVMVDNGSTDDSVAFVRQRFPAVQIVRNAANLGYARGFNAGLEYAAGRGAEYFLIMNNDTVIDRHALSGLVEAAQACLKAGFVTGKIYYSDKPGVLQTVGKKEDAVRWNGDHIGIGEKDVGQYESMEERAFLDDVMTLVSRKMYDDIGGYDQQFFLQCEEFDWQARAKKKGWRLYYTPKARLWHKVSMSMGGAGNSIGRYFDTRSHIVVMARYVGVRRFLRYYFYTGFVATKGLLAGILQANPMKIRPRLAMLLGIISGTFWLIHRRPATKVPSLIHTLNR